MILYYWIQGAPEDRMGGPWWHREFDDAFERDLFLLDLKPFLHAYCEATDGHICKDSLCGRDTPPKRLTIIYLICEMVVGYKRDEYGDSGDETWGDETWCKEKATHLCEGTRCCDDCAEKQHKEGFTVTSIEGT